VRDHDRASGAPLSPTRGDQDRRKVDRRLDTWKEIGAFFGRDERTVKRWEATRGLPVHRVPGSGRATVYAYVGELERWLESSDVALVESIPVAAAVAASSASSATIRAEPQSSPETDSLPISPELDVREEAGLPLKPISAPPFPVVSQPRPGRVRLYIAALLLIAGIAGVIGYRLRVRGNQPVIPPTKHAVNAEAQEFYLKGEYYLQKRTPESLNLAVDNYTQAIVRDPGYAQAYAGLADCYNLLREYTGMPDREAYPRALAAARQAIALDDSLSSAHSALAFVDFFWLLDVGSAGREFKRAIELDPNSINAHHWYASYLLHLGRFQESLAEIDRTQTLDPSSTSILSDKGLILFCAGHPDEAIGLLKQLETAEPTFLSPRNYLASIYLDTGDYRGFLDESTQAAQLLQDQNRLAIMEAAAAGFQTSGYTGMLEAILAKQVPLYEANHFPAFYIAETHARLGHQREALNYLRTSLSRREPAIVGIRMSAGLKNLHKEPEYRTMLAQLGFPPLPE
jgi:tetratricopeptide (TPR) repeat protein